MCRRPERGARRAARARALVSLIIAGASAWGAGAAPARAADLIAGTGAAVAPAGAAPPAYTTVVRAPGGPPQAAGAAVEAEQGRHLAGAGGDPALAAQDLPAVARPAPGATGLVIGGTTPAESSVLYEGIEIPALFHFGGFRSTVGAELIGRIEVVPAGFSAEYGRAVGGLVRIDARAPDRDPLHLVLDANLLDGSASVRGAGPGRSRVAAAARASVLDRTYGRYAPAGTTALFPLPRYADAQLDASIPIAPGSTLRVLALASLDRVRRDLGSAAAGLADRVEDQRQSWWRAGLLYSERGDDDGLAATVYLGGDRILLDQRFGAAPATQDLGRVEAGVRARYRALLAPGLRLTLGLDGLLARTQVARAGSLTVPAREGDVTVFGQPPGDDVNADHWFATLGEIAPFLGLSLARGAWTVSPGLRASAFPVDGSRALPPVGATPPAGFAQLDGALDPRLTVAWAAAAGLILTGAAGIYHQPVDPADLSAVFGSPQLTPARARHALLSIWKRLPAHTSVEVTAFHRALDRLAVRSPLPVPILAQALASNGRGRSAGVSVLVRRELAAGTLAWLSYTLSRSQRSTAGGAARLLDFDQTQVLTVVASHQRGGWILGGRARYATGMPRTPVTGSFLDARDGVAQPLFGAPNSRRLPAFFQLDARLDRTLTTGPVRASVYLDVQNLTGRRNPEEVVYSQDFGSSGYFTGWPLLALVGLRIES